MSYLAYQGLEFCVVLYGLAVEMVGENDRDFRFICDSYSYF